MSPDERAGDELVDAVYLPFTPQELASHFVRPTANQLAYYLQSVGHHHDSADPTSKLAVQIEKDERFWVITALKRLYDRWPEVDLLARLMEEAFPQPPSDYPSWDQALGDERRLYFEVALPAPADYLKSLKHEGELAVRNPAIPHLLEVKPRMRYEGQTWVDAILISGTGVAILFEAKVLSDISCRTTWDSTRNQIARNVDVMLERNPNLSDQILSRRDPHHTYFVLVTDALFQQASCRHNRLYGWLMDEYRKPGSPLLQEHIPHRAAAVVDDAGKRLGWITWQQIHRQMPGTNGACPWLDAVQP